MKKTSNKNKIAAIAIVLLMASVLLTLYAPAQAQDEYENMQEGGSIRLPPGVTPDLTAVTKAYLSFRPNPVGVGQTILVNMWTSPALHVSRYHTDYTITITDPDGNEDVVTLDSYRADATGWFEYVVDQVGTWTLKFEFLGGYFPPGNYTIYEGAWETRRQQGDVVFEFTESCYYTPSSTAEQELVVQEEPVLSWPPSPLPTDYWTRPVSPEHREWWPILGGYPGNGVVGGGSMWDELYPETNIYGGSMSDCEFYPWVQGPNTAHVLWKRKDGVGGLIGGPAGIHTDTDSASTPNLVYAGRCYDTMDVLIDGVPTSCAVCYDLRTGEIYYAIPTSEGGYTPSYISYTRGGRIEVPGATERTSYSVDLISLGSTLRKIDPEDGDVDEYPGMSGTFYRDPYVLSVQNLGGGNYRLINWTTAGSTDDFSERVMSNITWPRSNLGHSQDFESMIAVVTNRVEPDPMEAYYESELIAISLITGQELWRKTVPDIIYSSSCTVADHGKVASCTMGGYMKAWDLHTGNEAWTSPVMDYPWSASGFGAYDATSAYGMLYRQAYDGVYAFDWDDGSIVWHYKAPTPYEYETPYVDSEGKGVYSFNSGAKVADGKIYTYNSEHTTTHPITRGWKIHCIDAFTGEGIWNLTSPMRPATIADGYLTANCDWQSTMYVIGKGQSATTVTAPKTVISLGESVVIEGTVLDKSPAQSGTPCVSKESMGAWMDYLHMQKAIPAEVTGVPVSLDALDPNGNYIHIGDVTTDGYSGTFGLMWTPEVPGTYAVTATFMGDDSYGSSFAQTYVGVGEAPEPPPEPVTPATEPEVQEDIDRAVNNLMPILYGTIAAVVVVALLVVYTLWTIRKRQ